MADTLVCRTLGEERINEICDKWGLNSESKEFVKEMLVFWEEGQNYKNMVIVVEKIGSSPQSNLILEAISEINNEFAIKRGGVSE